MYFKHKNTSYITHYQNIKGIILEGLLSYLVFYYLLVQFLLYVDDSLNKFLFVKHYESINYTINQSSR